MELEAALDALKGGSPSSEAFKTLRIACSKSSDTQDLIFSRLGRDFFVENLKSDNPSLFDLLNLVNNLCIENPNNQDAIFPILIERLDTFPADTQTQLGILRVFVVCTQLGSDFRSSITLDFVKRYFSIEDHEEIDILVSALLPPLANEVLDYAMNHEEQYFHVLDLLHEACEFQADQIDVKSFVDKLLELIKQPKLPFEMMKSKVMAIFSIFIAANEDARLYALDVKAGDIVLETKKIDSTDPILLEWSIAALRILSGVVDKGE